MSCGVSGGNSNHAGTGSYGSSSTDRDRLGTAADSGQWVGIPRQPAGDYFAPHQRQTEGTAQQQPREEEQGEQQQQQQTREEAQKEQQQQQRRASFIRRMRVWVGVPAQVNVAPSS